MSEFKGMKTITRGVSKSKNRFKILNRIIIATIILLLLLLLLSYGKEQSKITEQLIIRSNAQTTQMLELEQKVNQLETANTRLEKVVIYQHNQIKELGSQPKSIEYITVTQPVEQVKVDKETEIPSIPQPSMITVVVGTLGTLGGMVKSLIPSFN